MLRLARHLSGMIGARRLAVVLGVLASFAVVVSLATILAIGSYLAFVKMLNLQFPVLPWFLAN